MERRPNVVWIFLDQCRADVLGCFGHPFVRTPSLDRLAANGVLFENAFCQNPICVPSRVSMLSGRYCHQTGVYVNSHAMQPQDSALLRSFSEAGYFTANVGKVHLGIPPHDAGFQEHRPIRHDGIPHMRVPDNYPASWPWRTFDAPGFPQPVIYGTDMCVRERTYSAMGVSEALDILEGRGTDSQPMLLRLSLDRPHTPVTSPKPYDTMYAGHTVLPDFPEAEEAEQLQTLRKYRRDRRWDLFTTEEILRIRSYYYGLVTHVDAELGRLLDAIDASPKRDDTVVVLTADHGCMLGEHGLYVKYPHFYSETARVPFMLAWPGRLPAGKRVTGLVEMVDLLPTLCDLCTIAVPDRAVGRSLVPVAQERAAAREDAFAEQGAPDSPHHWVGIRTRHHAYTHYTNTGERMLFDLRVDAREQNNLMLRDPDQALIDDLEARIRARRRC